MKGDAEEIDDLNKYCLVRQVLRHVDVV
jgi:hypothetical protein